MHVNGIQVLTVGGSVRPGNFTSKTLALVVDEARRDEGVTVTEIDVARLSMSPPGTPITAEMKGVQALVAGSTGLIIATPEYHGSYSSVIKLFIENMGFPSVLAGKPVALLGVAAGQIGAIKALEHLRSVCSHIGAIVLPGTVSVAGVQNLFDEQGRCLDGATEKRVRNLARQMIDYIRANICPRIALEQMARQGSTDWMKLLV